MYWITKTATFILKKKNLLKMKKKIKLFLKKNLRLWKWRFFF